MNENLTPYEGYIKGLNAGWELARKLRYDLTVQDITNMFNLKTPDELICPYHFIMHKRNGLDAMKAYEAWEDRVKVQLGDVVCLEAETPLKGIVLEMDTTCLTVFTEEGVIQVWGKGDVLKTNKHIEVTDWLIAGIQSAKTL